MDETLFCTIKRQDSYRPIVQIEGIYLTLTISASASFTLSFFRFTYLSIGPILRTQKDSYKSVNKVGQHEPALRSARRFSITRCFHCFSRFFESLYCYTTRYLLSQSIPNHGSCASGRPISYQDATIQRLPDLIKSRHRTTRESSSSFYYEGPLARWTTFESEVRANFESLRANSGPELSATLMYEEPPRHNQNGEFGNEVVIVGNEIGVSGRFSQHVGHVTTCTAQRLGLPLSFADWRPTGEPGAMDYATLPDVTFVDMSCEPRVISNSVSHSPIIALLRSF